MDMLLTAVVLAGVASEAFAVRPSRSIYTALDLSHCDRVTLEAGVQGHRCEGLPGYPVYVAEGEFGYFVSVGADAEVRRAASQTLKASNTLFRGQSTRTTIEWRFIIRDERPAPYATIVRYFTRSGGKSGEVLVVTRVTDREACHIAYIDAVANSNAIVLARRMADERARKGDCKGEPVRIGATGRSPM